MIPAGAECVAGIYGRGPRLFSRILVDGGSSVPGWKRRNHSTHRRKERKIGVVRFFFHGEEWAGGLGSELGNQVRVREIQESSGSGRGGETRKKEKTREEKRENKKGSEELAPGVIEVSDIVACK
jgi:hypothetical protein